MEHMPILRDLTVIIAVGMAVAVALSLLRLPTAAGLLAGDAVYLVGSRQQISDASHLLTHGGAEPRTNEAGS